jgi:hypothetical protein
MLLCQVPLMSAILLSVIVLIEPLLGVILPNGIIIFVTLLSVIMPSVAAPQPLFQNFFFSPERKSRGDVSLQLPVPPKSTQTL